MSRVYDDLETMLRDRGIRQRADGSFAEDSYDYGIWWVDGVRRLYRLTWIGARMREDESKAGELYLVRLDGPKVFTIASADLDPKRSLAARDYEAVGVSVGSARGSVELLCIMPPGESRPSARVDVLLAGWADACGTPNSVAWIRDRVAIAIVAGLAYEPGKEPSNA